MLKRFRRYLSTRKQFILFVGFKTETKIVECGVPQSFLLGLLLFLIFINELNNSTTILDSKLSVNDTNLFFSDGNIRLYHSRSRTEPN